MSYDDALDLPRDENGRITGYLVGKAAAIADWQAAKEEREYEALFRKLRRRKYRLDVAAEDGDRLKTRRERQLAYAMRPELVAERKASARRAHMANPTICTCAECGAKWCLVFGAKGPRPRFCSKACYHADYQRRKRRKAGKRAYRCGSCGEQGHNRLRCRELES